ncbi:winged helix DNA-binding domain-containing protein [Chitinophaga silvatica]|uniref:Winged helix DNA-binding domain-containing protein n=1 Tax=Chitinophaga silvatica TaxID=2282649 RepID=A0A3E1YDK0_9BACT|nr:winged helix DNA-binding domain-containing protein [Chitinophaga silvatica]RFS24592.1 winged helix DNA-binding domain-containing protein [Chitinophaga silvatica]
MKPEEFLAYRLANHQLLSTSLSTPLDIVSHMGPIQAQEYGSSHWAIGARLPNCTIEDVQQAFTNKEIVRITCLRGTLHVVAATEVRAILQVIAPAVRIKLKSMQKKLEMDEKVLAKTNSLIVKALKKKQLSREELSYYLHQHGVNIEDNRMNHILYEAAISGLICNSPDKGIYVLQEDWLPPATNITGAMASGILAKQYFSSHGPASLADFAFWSGLSVTEAKLALQGIKDQLSAYSINNTEIYTVVHKKQSTISSAFLLPAFDEYFLGYKDRSQLIDQEFISRIMTKNGIFNPIMVLNGRIAGLWRRTIKSGIEMNLQPFKALAKKEMRMFEEKAEEFAHFMKLPLKRLEIS